MQSWEGLNDGDENRLAFEWGGITMHESECKPVTILGDKASRRCISEEVDMADDWGFFLA